MDPLTALHMFDRFAPAAVADPQLSEEGPRRGDAENLVEETITLSDGEICLMRPRNSEALLDEHAFERDEFLPYWADLWPSGLVLGRRLSGRALYGARVLELGCGLGFPSLVAARAGGRVLATDWSASAVNLLARNAATNDLRVRTACVDWARPQQLIAAAPFDLVLAADVLYERRNIALLLALLPRLGDEVWLADPGRSFAEVFLARASGSWSVRTSVHERVLIHRLKGTTR